MTNPPTIGDGQLVEACLAGQSERFDDIVARYQGPLLRVAQSRLGRREWAEEAVQEAMLAAYRSLHTYDSTYSFRTWLWTILLNQCRRIGSRNARQPRVHSWTDGVGDQIGQQAAPTDLSSNEPCPTSRLLEKEERQQLESLLVTLPVEQADALRLRFFGGLKFREIAQAMECSLSSAKNRVRWGLLKMARQMPDEAHASAHQPSEELKS